MAALQGAIALPEVDHPLVGIRQDLPLDVAPARKPAFEEDTIVAEGRARLLPGRRERRVELSEVVDRTHPATAAAARRLDQERRSEPGGGPAERGVAARGAPGGRHAPPAGGLPGPPPFPPGPPPRPRGPPPPPPRRPPPPRGTP